MPTFYLVRVSSKAQGVNSKLARLQRWINFFSRNVNVTEASLSYARVKPWLGAEVKYRLSFLPLLKGLGEITSNTHSASDLVSSLQSETRKRGKRRIKTKQLFKRSLRRPNQKPSLRRRLRKRKKSQSLCVLQLPAMPSSVPLVSGLCMYASAWKK